MSEQDLWQGVLYLHLLAMAFFVGGQLVFAIAVVPVERAAPDRERMRAVARRFGYGSLCALGVLVATGWAMASHDDRFGDSTLQVKLGLVGLVVALSLLHLRRPRLHVLQAAILIVSLVIVWLGLDLAS
jgi:putative copper export protein